MNIVQMIALVNRDDCRTAVWHVDIGPPMVGSRLGGAWVMDNDIADHRVIVGRHVFLFGDVMPPTVEASITSVIDVPGTLANIANWIAEYDKIHAESLTELGNRRLPISWPRLPQPLDWNALPAAPTGVVDDKLISETIVAAHWMADLAQTWQAIETLRLSRAHLRGGDLETRILPFALEERVPA
jgi:hypothetical protein